MFQSGRVKRWAGACAAGFAAWCVVPPAAAQPGLAGRWQGQALIPGAAPLVLVIDIAPAPGGSGWVGSAILPGRGVKGAPLVQLSLDGERIAFSLDEAMPAMPGPALQARLERGADGQLAGTLSQGPLSAPLRLERAGAAQVDLPQPGTALAESLLGTWVGRYELGGYPREVTLTLANRAGGLGGGSLVIVGRRRSELTVDHVVMGREFVTLEARAARLRIEGRHGDGTIAGRLVQGPFEAPLVLRREGRS